MRMKLISCLCLAAVITTGMGAFAQESDKKKLREAEIQAKRKAELRQQMEMLQLEDAQHNYGLQDYTRAQKNLERAKVIELVAMASILGSPLNEENEQTALEFAQTLGGTYASGLKDLKKSDEEKYKRTVWKYLTKNRTFKIRAGNDQERYELLVDTYKLDLRVEELLQRYQKADANEKANVKTRLRQTLAQLFDHREQERQMEVLAMEEKLQELRRTIDLRKKNKDLIVDSRLKELLGEKKPLEW